MAFKYFQAFGLVVFKQSFFEQIQANTSSKQKALEFEVTELKKQIELMQDEKEMMKRIQTLQSMVKEERAIREKEETFYKQDLKYYVSKIKSLETSLLSDNSLFRDIQEYIDKMKRKLNKACTDKISEEKQGVEVLKNNLRKCEDKIVKVQEVVEEFKSVPKPANSIYPKVEVELPKLDIKA